MRDLQTRDIPIDLLHYYIHIGQLHEASISTTLSAAGTLSLNITASATKDVHIVFDVSGSNSGNIVITKNDTLTAETGTEVTPTNNNDNYDNSITATILQDPTISAAGDTIKTIYIGSSTGFAIANSGGQSNARFEYIIKKENNRTITFTADNNSTNIAINANFYEV